MEQTQIKPEVQIEERSVSIKALRVGTKQFTQTLFKQLPVADSVIDCETGLIAGDIWGRVILPQEWDGEREYLLWEYDGRLCQCAMFHVHSDDSGANSYWKRLRKEAEYYLMALALAGEKQPRMKWEYAQCFTDLVISKEQVNRIPVSPETRQCWEKSESLEKMNARLSEPDGTFSEHFIARLKEQRDKVTAELQEIRGMLSLKLLTWYGGSITEQSSMPTFGEVEYKIFTDTLIPYWGFQATCEASRQTILASEQLFLGV